MLQLQHKTLNRRRHIRRDDWARAVHTPLPRQIIEATATIEQCEICFLAHDPRQPDLFPTTAAVVPRQFCGDPRLSGEEDETPTSSKPTVTFTLQDLLK